MDEHNHRTTERLSRRRLLGGMAAAAALTGGAAGQESGSGRLKVCIFSKHLQWLGWQEAAAAAKQIGFDGVDLTVRAGGHVLPERVTEDLPKAVEAVHRAGLETPMITAGIVDCESPHAEEILRTASKLGIRNYRWGGFTYAKDRSIPEQIEALKPRVKALEDMNRHYSMCAMYHTHSGPWLVGAPQWDLWMLLRDFDSRWVGVNYDIGHATVEGGYGGWLLSEHLMRPLMRGVALKDFRWSRNGRGEWTPEWCPMGEGMVHFAAFFRMLQETRFSGPVQVHYEYKSLGGAQDGKRTLSVDREQVLAAMRRDLEFTRKLMRDAQI
ncbi:MAG TPA: TIM barrel protein [Bryobacteraceae bacterium]|nr:TIM barrel protein [Bryobacteraceae bacterium]